MDNLLVIFSTVLELHINVVTLNVPEIVKMVKLFWSSAILICFCYRCCFGTGRLWCSTEFYLLPAALTTSFARFIWLQCVRPRVDSAINLPLCLSAGNGGC